ncbi:MAG: DUF1475 family protein [Acidobacteriota bacterium]
MTPRNALLALFATFFVAMLAVTVHASLDRSVLLAAGEIWADPWGKATLFDTYFAFLTCYLWMAYREPGWGRRVLWLLLVLTLGTFAISAYTIRALLQLPPDASLGQLLERPARSR